MRKKVAYYTNADISYEAFRDLKSHYMKDYNVDFFICSENPITNIIIDTACINAYYLSWLKGDIIFTNIDDLNKKRNNIIGKPILYLKHDHNLELSDLDCEVLIRDKKGTIK